MNDRHHPTAPAAGPQQFTGRYLVLGQPNDPSLPRMLRDRAGLRIASASDFPQGAVNPAGLGGADGVYLDLLGVAVTSSSPDQMGPLSTAAGGSMTIEPERYVFALTAPRPDQAPMMMPAAFGGGMSIQSVDALLCSLIAPGLAPAAGRLDESLRTWGLVSTGACESSRTGRGVRIAVLDTGFDLRHGDYAGRSVVSSSFVEGESAQDGNGHGTHCIGTAAGPSVPGTLPRYGIAGDAEIYAGKVISDRGRGSDGSVLAGLNWAIGNGCRIVSMSLGTATQPGQAYSQVYESVAQRALAANTLLIAAAGNESRRDQGQINPVGHPANCPSVMAVGAVDSDMQIANFSTRGTGGNGGAIDLVAPGVDVYSTIPPSTRGHMSGTSMACPHVAGIAALYVEAHPNASAREIWDLMVRNARRLNLDAADAGAGLVQAPR